jgi:hypothetical protein
MNDCSLIQFKEKDESHLPPTGLVYFPPPPPRWSRLQHVTPLRLHRILRDTPDTLRDTPNTLRDTPNTLRDTPNTLLQFFEDVRCAAK